MTSTTTITINGKVYHSIDEVPHDLRHLVEDKNADGLPDHFEHLIKNFPKQNSTTVQVQNSFSKSFTWPKKSSPEFLLRLGILALGIALGIAIIALKK